MINDQQSTLPNFCIETTTIKKISFCHEKENVNSVDVTQYNSILFPLECNKYNETVLSLKWDAQKTLLRRIDF